MEMKTFFYLSLLLALIASDYALASTFASASLGNYSNPEYPGKCVIKPAFILSPAEDKTNSMDWEFFPDNPDKYVNNKDLILSPGVYKNPANCGRIQCFSNGIGVFHFCGPRTTDIPGCNLGVYADVSANYPQCCKRELFCPNNPDFNGKVV